MKTRIHPLGFTGRLISMATAVLGAVSLMAAAADIPDSGSREFAGMYKIGSSTDPIFPMQAKQEWFLDFGKGISPGKMSGNVAVSLRQNPNVKVRILAWQYFPKQGVIAMGNPYFEGSRNAVAKGNWQMRPVNGGFVWERGNYQVVLRPADPGDY